MSKQKTKRNYSRTIDLIFLLILLCMVIAFFYIASTFAFIPKNWLFIGGGVCLLVYLILFLSSLKELPKWVIFTKRVFIVLLCGVLATSGFFIDKSRTTIKKMNATPEEETFTEIMVITPKGSTISSLKDLAGKRVGYQNESDKTNADYAKAEIEKNAASVQSINGMDYTTLVADLINGGTIDALVISENYYGMTKSNTKDFDNVVKTIATIKKKNPVKEVSNKDITKESFVVYLSGLDNMGSPDQQTRTDTNLLLIVNPVSNHIDMISLPRDGYIPNTATGNANDKLTHTAMYGIDTSVETIEQFFGIDIDYYARVSFNSLIEIVDTIGGVDVDVEIDFCEQDENRDKSEAAQICLNKGKQKINGKQALAYSRHRKTIGYDNPGRERAQQRIIKAIIDKLLSPSALSYLNSLLDIAPNYIMTNMPSSQIASFVSSELESRKPWTISSIASDTGVYDSQFVSSIDPSEGKKDVYLFNKDEVQAVMNAYDAATHQLQMNTFGFELQNLYKNAPTLNTDPNILWDYMASNAH